MRSDGHDFLRILEPIENEGSLPARVESQWISGRKTRLPVCQHDNSYCLALWNLILSAETLVDGESYSACAMQVGWMSDCCISEKKASSDEKMEEKKQESATTLHWKLLLVQVSRDRPVCLKWTKRRMRWVRWLAAWLVMVVVRWAWVSWLT